MAAMSSKSEVPAFSYAQAAKGMSATPQSSKQTSTDSDISTSKPDEEIVNSGSQTNADPATTESEEPREPEKTITEKDSEPAPSANPKPDVSGASSPSVGTVSTSALGKDDDTSNTPNGTSESTWDKQSQASGVEAPAEKPKEKPEGGKKKSKSSEKAAASKEPPKELKVAPPPSVNIWQQRKEAQDAKAKAVASSQPAPAPTQTAVTKTATTGTPADNQELSKTAPKKTGKDAVSEGTKDRKRADGGKGREDDSSIPVVGDATSWPTPQVAQGEEKRKAQEKSEKSDKGDKSPVARPHGKEKWTPVPYVPTAVFNTPLPSATRKGAKTPRSGRDGGRTGAQATGLVDKSAAAKQSASADKGRNEPNLARANSLPAQVRRSNSADVAKASDARKNSQPIDRSRGVKGSEDAAARQVNGSETFPRQHRDAKPPTRSSEAGPQKADNVRNSQFVVDPQNGSRRFENGPKSADLAGFQNDRDHSRDSRADRGRGSHRGRGGFGGAQNPGFVNTHMAHTSYVPQKPFGFSDRQRQQQGLSNGSQQSHRMSMRSPPVPGMYGAYGYPDMNAMYGYAPVQTGPMSAMPYQQYMEPFSLMSMISMQLEYYFSVDNLCKDLFLRKHMDSQGFVALSFIAGFKRIKTLTEDFEMLRHVSRQLRNVEHQAGEDGVDRLRPRERWQQWVLPMDQRDPSGQSEGTAPAQNTGKPEDNVAMSQVDGAPNGVAPSAPQNPVLNGTGTPLSSAAPEFSPSRPVTAQFEAANVQNPMMVTSR